LNDRNGVSAKMAIRLEKAGWRNAETRPEAQLAYGAPKNKRIDCGCTRRAFVRLRIHRVLRLAFAASKSSRCHRTQRFTE
jgi:hypothetical protein